MGSGGSTHGTKDGTTEDVVPTRRLGCYFPAMLRFQRLLTSFIFLVVGCYVIGPLLTKYKTTDLTTFPSIDINPKFPRVEDSVPKSDPISTPLAPSPSFSREGNIRILSWTNDNITNWPIGTETFEMCKFPAGKTCESVIDRSFYNQSEIILFHGQKIDPQDMPSHRFHDHRWMFYEIETPPQTWIQETPLDSIRSVFNLTSTITFDSHIPIIERHRTCYLDDERYNQLKKDDVNYATGKGPRVAWFVSHCHTQSKREDYAAELAKYIPVDIWGKCGNFSCGNKYQRGDCDKEILNKDYKFYLSFENSVCESYVTEKLWRLIQQPITSIPIAMGGVNYKNILPERTYLDIKDFSSPKALADRLKEIDKDDNEFNEIIRRKNSLICKHPGNQWYHNIRYQCELCKYLHAHRSDVTRVKDVLDFWSEDRRCTKAVDYYKGSFEVKS